MVKRGVSALGIVLGGVFLLIVIGVAFMGVRELRKNTGTFEQKPTGAQEQIGIKLCSDYEVEEECRADIYIVGGNDQPGFEELNCVLNEVNCGCVWESDGSLCKLGMINTEDLNLTNSDNATEYDNQTNQTLSFDLEAFNLTLTNNGCTNKTNVSDSHCNVSVEGTIKNIGTEIIDKEFLVKFIDGTDRINVINIFTIKEAFAVNSEKKLVFVYEGLLVGSYWIQMKLDTRDDIVEINEDNNKITESIKLK